MLNEAVQSKATKGPRMTLRTYWQLNQELLIVRCKSCNSLISIHSSRDHVPYPFDHHMGNDIIPVVGIRFFRIWQRGSAYLSCFFSPDLRLDVVS